MFDRFTVRLSAHKQKQSVSKKPFSFKKNSSLSMSRKLEKMAKNYVTKQKKKPKQFMLKMAQHKMTNQWSHKFYFQSAENNNSF